MRQKRCGSDTEVNWPQHQLAELENASAAFVAFLTSEVSLANGHRRTSAEFTRAGVRCNREHKRSALSRVGISGRSGLGEVSARIEVLMKWCYAIASARLAWDSSLLMGMAATTMPSR